MARAAHRHTDMAGFIEADRPCCFRRQIDVPTSNPWAAIINTNCDAPAMTDHVMRRLDQYEAEAPPLRCVQSRGHTHTPLRRPYYTRGSLFTAFVRGTFSCCEVRSRLCLFGTQLVRDGMSALGHKRTLKGLH